MVPTWLHCAYSLQESWKIWLVFREMAQYLLFTKQYFFLKTLKILRKPQFPAIPQHKIYSTANWRGSRYEQAWIFTCYLQNNTYTCYLQYLRNTCYLQNNTFFLKLWTLEGAFKSSNGMSIAFQQTSNFLLFQQKLLERSAIKSWYRKNVNDSIEWIDIKLQMVLR